MRSIAFFDFDGTLTTHDSLKLFLENAAGSTFKFYFKYYIRCSLLLLKLRFNKVELQKVKEKRLTMMLKSFSEPELEELSLIFAAKVIPNILRQKGIEKVLYHKNHNHEVVIVSASIDLILKPWCHEMGIDLITNQVVRDPSTKAYLFKREDCNGIQKVKRIEEHYDLTKFEKVYAYGDTSGDYEMLNIADEQFYRPFE